MGERSATATGSKPTGTDATSEIVWADGPEMEKISRRSAGVLAAKSSDPSAERASGRTEPDSKSVKVESDVARGLFVVRRGETKTLENRWLAALDAAAKNRKKMKKKRGDSDILLLLMVAYRIDFRFLRCCNAVQSTRRRQATTIVVPVKPSISGCWGARCTCSVTI